LPHADFHTLAGLAFDLLGRVGVAGDELRVAGLRVLAIDGPRIRTLEMQLPVAPAAVTPV
jgi:CBS domain containing-hemolysin-like protein